MLRRNILIFHQAALGDFVVTLPIAGALGRLFPQNRVIYVTAASKGALARELIGVEWTDAELGWHFLHQSNARLPDPASRLLEAATLVVHFGEPGPTWADSVGRIASPAPVVPIRHDLSAPAAVEGFPADARGHVIERLIAQLPADLVPPASVAAFVRSVRTQGLGRSSLSRSGVVIHPGSGSLAKNWPIRRFAEVARELRNRGHEVTVVLGEAERERMVPAEMASLEAAGRIATPGTYLELLGLLRAARLYLGNDSGPSHLAAISGTPTVAVFGTDPTVWKPFGPLVRVVRGEAIEQVHVDDVTAAASELLGVSG